MTTPRKKINLDSVTAQAFVQSCPLAGPAAGGAEIRTRRCVGPLQVTQLLQPAYGQLFPKGPAAGGSGMYMCPSRRVASAARARPVVPVGPTAGGAASCSAVQLQRGQHTARGPGWARGRRRLSRQWRSESG
jgi:hypothetical protein